MLPDKLASALGALLLLLGCTANVEPGPTGEARLPALVAQRVTATVQREASRLVRLETEHEAFLTTPEHPFATPRSGWVSAGRLRPGDWVVSERFGAVRLVSVSGEPAARPVPVFNLSVASTHTYLVGTGGLLVHNTNCKPKDSESPEESPEETITRLSRERDELNGRIKALTRTPRTSSELAQLRTQRNQLQRQLDSLRTTQRRRERKGVPPPSKDDRARQIFEEDNEAARKALEDAQKELAELESRPQTSETEKGFAARKAKLENQVRARKFDYERTTRILAGLRELAKLEEEARGKATDAERRAVEEKMKELRANLAPDRKRAKDVRDSRKKRADPERRAQKTAYDRARWNRQLRTEAYLADTERPRDRLELLEEERAGLLEEAPSESRDARIQQLTDQIDVMKRLVGVRREQARTQVALNRAKSARRDLIAEGKDTRELDKKVEQFEREYHARRIEIAVLRVEERLLAPVDEALDAARLREFERQLSGNLVDDQQLTAIEQALDATDPAHADLQDAVLDEAHDVDDVLREREDLLGQSPSPERASGLRSNHTRLMQELREERLAVEAAVSQLANEYASIQTTQAGSSSGPTWQERLRAIHQEQLDLRANWRARLSARLASARRRREDLQSPDRLRDEASEAELAREIALLERELQNAGG